MHLNQKIVLVLAGSTLSFAQPVEAVLGAALRTANKVAGGIIAYDVIVSREKTVESWKRVSTTLHEIHAKHAQTTLGTTYPVCDQFAATAQEVIGEVKTYLQEKPTSQASAETTEKKQPSAGEIIWEDGVKTVAKNGALALGAFTLIKIK